MKWYLEADVGFNRGISEGITTTSARFVSAPQILIQPFEIEEQLDEAYDIINNRIEKFTQRGSGWIINNIITTTVNSATYSPIAAS